ncbi:ParB/RepB/Spo0J family partition protein [Streptomyces flavofungini]|uniref:ParB/RepB/Spo0J family partition protein n=1 Tax=Streptomyces flavofungini TaxID=68200 RepID=UPI0034DDF280
MREVSKKVGAERVTQGFTIDEEAPRPSSRAVRTRSQILNGEGRRPPAAVKLAELAHNPYNPRDELSEIEECAESLRARGQIQPVTVARRAAFLSAHPGRDEEIGEAAYVVIDGNRRLAAAQLAGLEELRIDVNDQLASSAADLLESALIANIHRVDVAPMDQAKAIQELVQVHGSQGQVAKRLGKTPAWVSQRLALLELTPELQEKVEAGELKVEPARKIGRMPKERQADAAEQAISAARTPRPRSPRTPADALTVNGVNTPGPTSAPAAAEPQTVNGVNTPAAADEAPEAQAVIVRGVRFPYDNADEAARFLSERMDDDQFLRLVELLAGLAKERRDAQTTSI